MKRRTRILATLGPASRDPSVLDRLIAAGLDAVRLNFSHGTRDNHAETYRRVREASARARRPIAVLQDLQGPKIRLGKLEEQITVTAGSTLTITAREIIGSGNLVPTDYRGLPGDVSVGMNILLDEGRLRVIVRSITGPDITCEVINGGVLSSNKGINVPGAALTASSMTDKDREDVRFGLDLGVDFVALSFVRQASDVEDLRRLMTEHGRVVPIIAKIEKPQAVEAIDQIVALADGVMVARGDLAVEASLEMIPAHQKRIIERANHAGKLVITATQMLESMTQNPLPTRAEVTDVANAILDGTDAVMLSGETAVGKYPVDAVTIMGSIAATTEQTLLPFDRPVRTTLAKADGLRAVTARIAAQAACEAEARAIVVFTKSGETAMRLSDERPRAHVVAFTRDEEICRRLALYWGVQPFVFAGADAPRELFAQGTRVVVEAKWAGRGDRIVFLLGGEQAADADHSIRIVTVE